MRFGPCKGVLAVNKHIQKKVRFRPSMRKFSIPAPEECQRTIEVIRFSGKSSCGHLNRQFVLLLHSLKLQQRAIEDIVRMTQIQLREKPNNLLIRSLFD